MRLVILILLLPAAMAFSLSPIQTWLASFQQPLRNLIDNPLRRSTVPQFLLDARHPWVLAHRRQLERLPNAEAFLCTELLDGTSGLEIPPDLFDRLEVDNNRVGMSRPGWPNAQERLTEMSKCPRALEQVKELEINIYVYEGAYSELGNRLLEPSYPPSQLTGLLGDVLESMKNLEKLNYHIPKEYTRLFGGAFQARKLVLPSVKHLAPGPWSHYLWYHGYFPDEFGYRFQWGLEFIQSTISAPKLKRFSMNGGNHGWALELVSEVVRAMPQIESLGLNGALVSDVYHYEPELGNVGEDGRLKATLNILNGQQNLTHLDLPRSSSLALGFDGGAWCGNAYFGKEGRVYERDVVRQGAEATEMAGEIVMENMPQLTSFTVGELRPNITRDSDGKNMVSLAWPWTGRMDEWLMEEVPEWVEGDL
ncbi:hypothetical protein GLAREA_10135 [Glarea lozoyensis ATCC 20868]|uniref:Uncharacterized protein n=1 Tax=Glarea lozoyensis (strain ATCC 20868 / MF5171) TaxID=1116229 RepID=S3DQZ1_GLAL2|nr:uncharacterized protein GLAREA_10135 [Glarea lozoyensis ATCC 20868]EPE34441.1 hypothetical protein GLAREA_10135 [Glarea lozoyensis ATCC 20868]